MQAPIKYICSLALTLILISGFFLTPLGVGNGTSFLQPSVALAQSGTTVTAANCFDSRNFSPQACAAYGGGILLTVGGYFAGLGAELLNYAVHITILELGKLIRDVSAITTAWAVLRDLANIGLIFGLLAIGIGTILQLSGYGIKELLARVIIVALLINFSLFATKVVIDIGNAVAVVAYKQLTIRDNGRCGAGPVCLAEKFMDAMKISTIYNVDSARAAANITTPGANDTLAWNKILLAGLFGSVVLIIAGFVFASGALLLIIRLVVLVILMIVSPVAWAAAVLPNTRSLFTTWWSTLLKEVIFAPVYLILLLASLWIVQDTSFTNLTVGTNDRPAFAAALLSGQSSSFPLFIHFAIIVGFLIASLVIARMIGSTGSNAITGYGKKWARSAGFALAGVAGRNTIGRAGEYGLKGYNALESKIERTKTGRILRGTASFLSAGLLQDRNITGALEAAKGAKFGSGSSRKSVVEEKEKRQRFLRDTDRKIQQEAKINAGIADPKRIADLDADLRNVSNKELEELDVDQLASQNVIANLSSGQIEYLTKGDNTKFTEQDKQRIKDARKDALLAKIKATGSPLSILKNPSETAKLPNDILTDRAVAEHLTASDLSAIARENKSQAIRDQIRAHIQNAHSLQQLGPTGLSPQRVAQLQKADQWLRGPAGLVF